MNISRLIVIGVLCAALVACDSVIYKGEGDCSVTYRVMVAYDYNMKWADATAAEVDSVNLFAYAQDGSLAWHGSKSADQLVADDFTLTVDVPAGTYDLVAWCSGHSSSGMASIGGYSLAGDSRSDYASTDAVCATIDHAVSGDGASATSDIDLHRLFHGSSTAVEFPDSYGTFTTTIPLVKNTNVVRVMLQQISGQELDPDEFVFTISDDNLMMGHDNRIIPYLPTVYSAWDKYSGSATMEDDSELGVNVVVAELTTGRLMAGHSTILTVSRPSGKTVLQIPLIDYVMMVKGNYNKTLGDQEYLDRKDEWNLTFFLDDGLNWISQTVVIEAWRLVIQTME